MYPNPVTVVPDENIMIQWCGSLFSKASGTEMMCQKKKSSKPSISDDCETKKKSFFQARVVSNVTVIEDTRVPS